MTSDTIFRIENINNSLKWVKENKGPEIYEKRFLELVGLRRKLRNQAEAEKEKPAIAAFGESQKGKSYLIANLLKGQRQPFKVKNEKGEWVNFVDRVNPIGDGKEATGVVTRFTSYNNRGNASRYQAEHPVIVKLFSVSSIATILCDSYYMDLIDKKFYADEEIKNITDEIYRKYKDRHEIFQDILTEDDILDIKSYLEKNVSDAQVLTRSGFFDKLAFVVRRIPQTEWASVLQYLWHENKYITNLFVRLVEAKRKLSFAREVYVDFDAVMHKGDNKNTIMSVDCLNGLDDESWSLKTNVYVPNTGGGLTVVSDFPKCELCAICAETIYKIEPDFLDGEYSYCYENDEEAQAGYMPMASHNKLPHSFKKDMLVDMDLLDFPGARNRLDLMEVFLTEKNEEDGVSNIVQMLLRGKVAYLFNKYNEDRIINILLFCHDKDQPSVNKMYLMIKDWVEKYVGISPRLRRQTIEKCGGVAPLFVIGTKFNMDMIETNLIDSDSDVALDQRWSGRFMKVLYTQSFQAQAKGVDWFRNWDEEGNSFKNTFLLRDFKYSGCVGKGNNLYEGYDESVENSEEKSLRLTPAFYWRLRDTFIKNDDVRKFFSDPALAWDVAATMNNDGALYIIEKLSIISKYMEATRKEQFAEESRVICNKVYSIMKEYLVKDDEAKILEDNIHKADVIFRELELVCQAYPEYFGHFLQSLQMSESESYKELHRLIPNLAQIVAGGSVIQDYQLIRNRCRNFDGCESENDKWTRLIEVYKFKDKEEAQKALEDRSIEFKKLFAGITVRRKNSSVIADHMLKIWSDTINSVSFKNKYAGPDKMDEIIMASLIESITNTAKNVKLAEKIENEITQYADVLNTGNINEDLVSDIVATTISDFIMDFGYHYLDAEQIAKAKKIAKDHHLPCFESIEEQPQEKYDEAAVTQLMDEILADENQFTPSYMSHYNNWIEYLYVASVANLEPSECNPEANEALKAILKELNPQ